MTPTKEQIDSALMIAGGEVPGDRLAYIASTDILAAAYYTKCAEVEALKGLIEEVVPVGDIADGLAPYYIEADTIRRMRKALEGKE